MLVILFVSALNMVAGQYVYNSYGAGDYANYALGGDYLSYADYAVGQPR